MHQIVREFEAANLKQDEFDFRPGDTVRVSVRIVEAGKERIQDFEGVCIRRVGGGMGETFTVRRVSYGVGMERIFSLHSPRVESIRVVRRGKVRRADLGYLRGLSGKRARITEDLLRSRKIAGRKAERLRELADMGANRPAPSETAAETPGAPAEGEAAV